MFIDKKVENGQQQERDTQLRRKKGEKRQPLSFDDFRIIDQVGEGTYGCVSFLLFPLPQLKSYLVFTQDN